MVEIVRNYEAEMVWELLKSGRITFTAQMAETNHTVTMEEDEDGALVSITRARFNLTIAVDGEVLGESIDPDLTAPPDATVERKGMLTITKYDHGRQDVKIGGHRFEPKPRTA